MRRLLRFIIKLLRSPLLALVFLVVPLVAFGQRFLGLPLPASFDVLLANNALLLLWLGARLVSVYLWRIPWAIRYGPVKFLRVRKTGEVSLGSESVRERLVGAGYVFDRDGSYGEKKDRGFWGALLLHAGLVFVFAFGTYDNLVQLSGTILHGVGQPAPLYEENYYAEFAKGPLAKTEELDIEFQIKKQHLPSVEWPGGATEAALLSKEGDELRRATISPGNPISIGGDMKIHMSGIVFDVWVVVQRDRDNMILYTGWTRLLPLKEKLEEYTYYGAINERSFPKVEGGVYRTWCWAWDARRRRNMRAIASSSTALESGPRCTLQGKGTRACSLRAGSSPYWASLQGLLSGKGGCGLRTGKAGPSCALPTGKR
jgi:hypothetical protein